MNEVIIIFMWMAIPFSIGYWVGWWKGWNRHRECVNEVLQKNGKEKDERGS